MKTTIELAREAGFNVKMCKPPVITAQHSNGSWVSVGDELKAFEALIRADQREIDAKVCETHAPTTTPTWVSYAAAIRARGNT